MGRSSSASRDHEQGAALDLFQEKHVHPVDKANWLSFATFYWMGRLMSHAYRQGLTDNDVPEISTKEACKTNTDLLEQLWVRELSLAGSGSRSRPSFSRVAWRYCRGRIFVTSAVYITSLVLGFLTPTILMKKIMSFARDPKANKYDGLKWVLLLVLCELGRVFFITLTWAMSYRTALRLKTASMGLLYRKLLRVGNLTDHVSAKLLNVISGDCGRLYELIVSGQVAIGGPIVLVMSSIYIWYELGWLPMLGLLTFLLAYPLQYFLAKGNGTMKRKAARIKDERVSLISQCIQHFKFLKMFSWEKYLFDTITDVREKERKYLVKGQLLQSFSVVLGPTLPHIAAILTFLIYICSGFRLLPDQAFCIITVYISRVRPTFMRIRAGFRAWFDAQIAVSRIQAFTTLFIFSLLYFSIRMVNMLYDSVYEFKVCSERMMSLLILPEAKDTNGNTGPPNQSMMDEVIVVNDMFLTRRTSVDVRGSRKSLAKESKKKDAKNVNSIERLLGSSNSENDSMAFQFGPIDLKIRKGSFIGICGFVGSGKTTFLEAIVGCLTTGRGTVNLSGRTAYVPQHPWFFKGTIRENITFGENFDSVRYYSSIDSCCLTNDFAVLPIGDLTRIDSSGSNLSGGQRQRISLARALYCPSSDIYLLDDPFSGLDNRVARAVFENVILNKLRKQKKTVILVTHQLNFLMDCDEILVFSDGKIVQRGTHRNLISENNEGSIYKGLWHTSKQFSSESQEGLLCEDSEILDLQIDSSAVTSAKKMQLELERSRKDVSSEVFLLYIRSAGGWLALSLVLLAFTCSTGSTAFSSWWLKHWFKGPTVPLKQDLEGDGPGDAVNSSRAVAPEYISSDSPDFIFNRDVYAGLISIIFVTSLIRSIFFVMTTTKASKRLHGNILRQFFCNRMKTLEKLGAGQVFNLFSRDIAEVDGSLPNSIESFLQNVFIVFTVLALVSGIFPSFLLFAVVVFVVFSFYKRIYNTAIRDLKRIEASRRSPIFTRISETVKGLGTIRAFNKERLMMEEFEKLTDNSISVSYAFCSSVRWLSIRLDSLAVLITGSVASLIFIFHGTISAAAAGLALAYAAQLSGVFQFTVRLASETEAKFVSVERMQTFLSYDRIEQLEITEEDNNTEKRLIMDPEIHPNWPTVGHVKFDAVTLSYSSNDSPVLREVSFEVQAGQNVCIIGKTGSGKSSIGNALFRLTELKSGSISIDGVDISTLSLQKLRKSMCVIPQDPSVFPRSVRFNLDPGKMYEDHELWGVLEKTGLKSSVDNLDCEVGLSHGQKQLLCIARALLRQSKIIFIDEATSNMDVETARIVEKLIAEEFKYSTVFIVAHRMSALSSCDYILIMADGEVKDYGPVDVLSKKPEFKESFEKLESVELDDHNQSMFEENDVQ